MIRRFIAMLLIVSLAALGVTAPAQAALVTSDAVLADAERSRVLTLIDRADVRARLQAYGVDAGEVKARVAALSDAEAAQLAAQIDSLPSGGDGCRLAQGLRPVPRPRLEGADPVAEERS